MVKAFLSHSSVDKDIVRKIKTKVQRIWTYFDEDCFEPGEDFRTAITERLADTNLFVLFVSANSLKSSWVHFEIDEAYWQTVQRCDIQVLVLTLEDISVSQLPAWMRKGKFERVSTAQLAAQIIKAMLFETCSIDSRAYIGRVSDIQKFYDDMASFEPCFPNVLTVTGLNGVGRRTFIKDIMSKRFSLDYSTEFYVDETETLIELYKKLLDNNIEDNTQKRISELYSWFVAASVQERATEVARILSLYTQNHTCPIVIDNGAMLDNMGFYKDEFLETLHYFAQNYPDHYLVLIHTRLPKLNVSDRQLIYLSRLYALDSTNCYTLFDSLLKRNGIPIADPTQVKEIAGYLEGYPPSIINATRECKLEGIDIVCNDKSSLVDFQARLFSKYFDKLPLSPLEQEILTLILNLGNVSIQILATLVDAPIDAIAASLRTCHDYNLVEQRSDGTYSISPPMRISIDRKLPRYDKDVFSKISNILIQELWGPDKEISFETVDIIINTVLRSGQEENLADFKKFVLPSHLLKAAEKANQATDWTLAEKYARRALDLDHNLNDARVLLFKELVRQETKKTIAQLNVEEDELLDILESTHDIRHYYLKGFRYLKRRKHYDAIEEFKYAIKAGDDSIPVHRDLAESYYQTGQIPSAQKEINAIMGPRKINNPFILDLATKIAISQGDLPLAGELLEKQELVDRYENVEHRRATYFMKAEDYPQALVHSTNACNGDRVLPEMHLLRMNIAIHLEEFAIVEHEYGLIDDEYKYYSFDTREALYTTMLLASKGWKTAEAAFAKISNKTSPTALNLKYKILNKKLLDTKISPILRQETEKEIAEIEGKRMFDILFQFQYYDPQK